MSESPGVRELAQALRDVQLEFGLEVVSGTMCVPGDRITLRYVGRENALLEIENEAGNVQVVAPNFLSG